MHSRFKQLKARKDSGFTLIELLVVVIIIGILSSIAVPMYLNQQKKAHNASVIADLKTFSNAAATEYTDGLAYPTTAAGFSTTGATTPISSDNNTFRAFVVSKGANAGFVIYGKNSNSEDVFILSSWNGSKPTKVAGATAIPTTAPATGHGIPTGATFAAAINWAAPTT